MRTNRAIELVDAVRGRLVRYSVAIAVVLAITLPSTVHAERIRVAIVGPRGAGTANAGGVVAIAEAKLSVNDAVEILDRQQIDQVLKEQKLNLTGLMDSSTAIKVGQLLSVDLFALVEQSLDGKEALACIVYDTKTGMRLGDVTLNNDGVERSADEVVSAIDVAVKKQAAGIEGMKLLSVVGVRNADLPRALDTTCESIGLLFERELARSGDVLLLERKRLGWLQQEQTISANEADRKLLASTLQADLQFSRHDGGVRATLIVNDAAGQQLHKAISDSRHLDATLVSPLVESLMKGLNAKRVASPTNVLRESQRFFREAELRWSFKEPVLAIQSAESALLLDPTNTDKSLLLAQYLVVFSTQTFSSVLMGKKPTAGRIQESALDTSLEAARLAQRGIELYEASYHRIAPATMEELAATEKRTRLLDAYVRDLFGLLPREGRISGERLSDWHDARQGLAHSAWRVTQEHLTRWRELTKTQPGAAFAYSLAVSRALMLLEVMKHATDDYSSFATTMLEEWLTSFESVPKPQQPYVYTNPVLRNITGERTPPPFDLKPLEPFLVRLEQHSIPLFQLHGRRARLNHTWSREKVSLTERILALRRIRVSLFETLDRPELKSDINIRRAYYEFLADSYSILWSLTESPEYEAECEAISQEMIVRRELHPSLFLLGATRTEPLTPEMARRALARIDAGLELARDPKVIAAVNWGPESMRQTLEKARAEFLVHQRKALSDVPSLRVQVRPLLKLPLPGEQGTALTSPKLFAPIVTNNIVVGLVLSQQRDAKQPGQGLWAQAVTIPLNGGNEKYFGEISTSLQVHSSGDLANIVTASCLHDGRYYAASAAGLFEFDLQTTKARAIDMSQNFPSTKVQALASFRGQLLLGLEGGYLASLVTTSNEFRVHASSRRKQKASPLDDREAFTTVGIVPDLQRQQVLFLIRGKQDGKDERGELWAFKPETNEFRRLLALDMPAMGITPVHGDRVILNAPGWAISLDLATSKTFVIASRPLGPDLTPNRNQFIRTFFMQPVFCADRLWSAHGQSLHGKLATLRLEVEDEQVLPVDIPQLEKDEIYAGWYVAPVDEKRFLWSNHHRIWLVTPENQNVIKQTTRQ